MQKHTEIKRGTLAVEHPSFPISIDHYALFTREALVLVDLVVAIAAAVTATVAAGIRTAAL